MIDDFEAALLEEKKKLCPRLHFNLTKLQRKTLKLLHQNPKFIIFACDKNLDPAIIERKEYIKRVFQDHLLNETTYKPLDESSSQWRLYFLYDQVQAFFKKIRKCVRESRTNLLSTIYEPQAPSCPILHHRKSPKKSMEIPPHCKHFWLTHVLCLEMG